MNAFAFDDDHRRALEALLARYPNRRAALLPALRLVEKQAGVVSDDAVRHVAGLLDLPPAEVRGVLSFYTHFRRPGVRTHRVMLCRTLPCALAGADAVAQRLEQRLGIRFGETTADSRWSLEYVECLGACGDGPCLQIDEREYGKLTPDRIDEILADVERAEPAREAAP